MKKNKLIILILALAVCSSLILSLCSFTTIKDTEDFEIMTPNYNVGVGYTYHRVTTTLNEYYYGFIPSFNQLLADSALQRWSTNRASDYLIVGTTSLDYSLDVNSGFLNQLVALTSDNPETAYFNGLVKLSGGFTVSDENPIMYSDYITFINPVVSNGLPNLFDFVVSGYFFRSDNSVQTFRFSVYGLDVLQLGGLVDENSLSLNVGQICNYLYDEADDKYFPYLLGDLFVDEIVITSSSNDFTASAINTNMLYRQSDNFSFFEDLSERIEFLRDSYGDVQYQNGYNSGVSDGQNTWASLGDFLTTTVGAFVDFEIVEGISIGGIISVFVGLSLVLVFLKMFAGG